MIAVEELMAYWTAQGLPLAPGVPAADIANFESRYALTLPSDLRAYFERVNGHVQRGGADSDREGFAFWTLANVQPLPSVCAAYDVPVPQVDGPDRYFVFADYLQWSWAYAIRLGTIDNPVILVGTEDPQPVAASFTEFVRLYLRDDEALYPR
ncbi:MAG TPA: SMI1/KNR4 family protein [Vicinamibacterales bacterium]